MKYLTIILVVLTIGSGLSLWNFDLLGQGGGQGIVFAATAAAKGETDPKTDDGGETADNSNSLPDDTPSDSNDVNAANKKTGSPAENTSRSDTGNPDGATSNDDSPAIEDKSEPEDPNDPLVAINLNNVEMKKLLDKLAEWTGKVIIPSDEAMKVKLTIYAAKKVPQSQALNLIYDTLRTKGIIAEISENKLFLKPIAEAKLGYVPVLSAEEPLARVGDRSKIVEKYFKLKNASASKLATVITPLTASYGHVTAYENTNSISVIDTVENLMRIEMTIQQFDAPDSNQVKEEVFEIKKGDPAEIVQVLELILNQASGRNPSRRNYSRPAPSSSSRGRNEASSATSIVIDSSETPIVLLPIPRHNWIIARASAEDLETIREWIKRLDIEESVPPEQTIIPVNYVDPYEVSRLVRNTIQEMPGSQLKASVVVEPMRNSKQIVVFGSKENRELVAKLIAEIDVPTSDDFKTVVFRLKHADPDEIKSNLEGLYESEAGRFSSYSYGRGSSTSMSRNVDQSEVVKVISFPTMKQVTVIGSEENIKKIAEQIKEWDVPMDLKEDQYRLVSLKNSDPVQLAELLAELFSEDSGSSSRSFWDMMYGSGNTGDKKKIVGSLYGLLTFKPVPGTKKLLIISQIPEAYDVIEKLIIDLDEQEQGEVPKVITLNYADAEELCDQLNAILNESGTRATLFRKQQGLSETDFNSTEKSGTGSSINQQQNNNNPGEIIPWWTQTRRNESERPTSNLIGKIRFVPVHRSKAILVLSPPEYLGEIEKMIADLDKPGKQVMIEAIIVEVDHATMTSLGVKLANGEFTGDLGTNAVAALTDVAYGRMFSSGVTLDSSITVSALVDLLAQTVNAKILNQPNLWTKDNEEAVFFKGREISLETSSQSYATSSAISRTEYKQVKVGVTLQVRPNITPENDVDTKINLEISDVANSTVNSQPVINKLTTTTKLIVGDGETIMLGGILFQNESTINSKIPLLGDIPIAGGLFSHDKKDTRNNELLVFITPHVVDGKDRAESKKYIKSPLKKLDDLKGSLSDNSNIEGTGTYRESPIQRMEDIRGDFNSALSEGLFEK